jgi:tetratricopeptide (TPR) repeat protein
MEFYDEGEQQAREALEICERLGDTVQQATCLITLARFSRTNVAEEALFRAIDLLPEKDEQFLVCESHQLLSDVYRIRGKMEKAIHHYEVALGIATSFGWHDQLFRIHFLLAVLFFEENRFDDGHAHIEYAMLYTVNNAFTWVAQCGCGPSCGTDSTGSKRRGPRFCVPPTFLRSLELHRARSFVWAPPGDPNKRLNIALWWVT